jgi:transposase
LSDSLLLVICQEVGMTRSLSGDLRGRVIAAIEDGVSTRAAARRFRIGISTAGAWYRRYRETGETQARKQGQPSRSKLDAHETFILDLVKDAPDITLAEIGERLAAERGVQAAPSTVWLFLDRRGITFKKRRRTPPSSSARTSCAAAQPGSMVSSISTPRG